MTTPSVDITEILPSKAKTWVGLLGSLVTLSAPLALSASETLPAPWPFIIGAVLAVLTALGVYQAPYKPAGTTLAVDPQATKVDELSVPHAAPVAVPAQDVPGTPANGYKNPWK